MFYSLAEKTQPVWPAALVSRAVVIDHPRLRADLDPDDVGKSEGSRGRGAKGPDAVIVGAGAADQGGVGVDVGRRVRGEAGGDGRDAPTKVRRRGPLDVEAVVG